MKLKQNEIKYHVIHDYYQSDKIVIEYIQSDENVADVFTKSCRKPSVTKI